MDDMTERGTNAAYVNSRWPETSSIADCRDVVRAVHAALTPADLATLAEGLDRADLIVLWRKITEIVDRHYDAGRIEPGQAEDSRHETGGPAP